MRLFLDACVLYPTVMREMLFGAARAGLFEPRFSARVLEEWARATVKLGPGAETYARGEIALLRAFWPKGEITASPALEARLYLPDPNDVHVLSCAIAGSCDGIVTMNAKDFPKNILAEEGLLRFDPDGYLHQLAQASPDALVAVAREVCATANNLSDQEWDIRRLLKKARLPRTGKTLAIFEATL